MIKIKKVLQITGSLKIGGLEKITLSYYENIDQDKFEFTYVVFDDEIGELEEKVKKLGGNVIHIPNPSGNYLRYIVNLKKIMRKYGPFDIVHSHVLFNSGLVMKVASDEKIPKRISHSHSNRSNSSNSLVRKGYIGFQRFLLNKYSTKIVSCSKDAGNYLFGQDYFNKHGNVIVNAINVDEFIFNEKIRENVRNRYNIQKKYVIGHTGSFNKAKNHKFILNVLNTALQENDDIVLMLVGDGPEKEKIIEYAEDLGIIESIIFVGSQRNVYEYLMGMDVFIFPSKFEGLGISLVEAQVANLPCIVSDNIPDEAVISTKTERISLNTSIDKWVDALNNYRIYDRETINSEVDKYRISTMMLQVNDLYVN